MIVIILPVLLLLMLLLLLLLLSLLLIMFVKIHDLGENNFNIIQAALFTPTYQI